MRSTNGQRYFGKHSGTSDSIKDTHVMPSSFLLSIYSRKLSSSASRSTIMLKKHIYRLKAKKLNAHLQ